jgi:hypothetical protein
MSKNPGQNYRISLKKGPKILDHKSKEMIGSIEENPGKAPAGCVVVY